MEKETNKEKNTEEEQKKNDEKNTKKSALNIVKSIIEYAIIIIVAVSNIFLISQAINNPNKTPSLFGKKAFVIISGSMIPEIQIGDIVIVKDTQNVAVNEIIAFRKESTVIVHRIIMEMFKENNKVYQTKGDNNNVADDSLVSIKDIEGKMVGKIAYLGNVFMFLYNHIAIIAVIMIVIILLRYYYSYSEDNTTN